MTPRSLLAGLFWLSLVSFPVTADEITVTATPIERFGAVAPGERSGGLVWRGGMTLTSQDENFGGLSGMGFVGPGPDVVFVTDRGWFVSGRVLHDDALRPLSLVGAVTEPLRNSSGAVLPRQYARDAEALAVVHRDGVPVAVRVGFENLTRVADFALTGTRPGGPAREVAIPDWLTQARSNQSLESVCIAPPASPVSGSTLLLTEAIYDEAGNHAAWLLGSRDRGALSYRVNRGTNPTDCAFLPDGDLLVLERGVGIFGFSMALRRVPAAEVRPGAVMAGETLLEASGGAVDNMEALGVYIAADGETRIVLVSDDNFSDWQRTLWLEFGLPR